jgi:hypothetical protein
LNLWLKFEISLSFRFSLVCFVMSVFHARNWPEP